MRHNSWRPTKYYRFNSQTMPMRKNGVLSYLHGDYLGNTVATNYYYPYGANRGGTAFSGLSTKRFTGQYHESNLPGGEGLSYYNARWYDAQLGRFLSADTIVPGPANPQAFNRYSYVLNNPLKYTDPTGHCVDGITTAICIGAGIGAGTGAALYLWNESQQSDGIDLSVGLTWDGWLPTGVQVGDDWGDLAAATGTGLAAGAMMPAGGVWAVAGAGMASNAVADHMSNLITGNDFSAPEHAVAGMLGAASGVATAGVGTMTSTFVKTGSQLLDDAIGIGTRAVTGGFMDTVGDVDALSGKEPYAFGTNLVWNVAGETFGQTLGSLGGEWVQGAWGMTRAQGNAFWGAWGSLGWKYLETPGRLMFEQLSEDN